VASEQVVWFGKPGNVGYSEFLARVPPAELWQRQLALGPGPEFCLSIETPPLGAVEPCVLRTRLLNTSDPLKLTPSP